MGKLSEVKIQGKCPSCGQMDSIIFTDLYYCNEKYPYAEDVPICTKCHYDEIRVRKINNRRYKVHEIQWDEYHEGL